jgi:O-antigen ligase
VSTLISLLVVTSTLAFGAVYPWGYLPLFAAAACIGLFGMIHRQGAVRDKTRSISVTLLLVAIAIGAQLVPVPRTTLDFLSPHAGDFLSRSDLTFTAHAGSHPLSLDPTATSLALLALAALALYLTGLPKLLSRQHLRALPRQFLLFAVPLALVGIFGREHNNGLVYGFWQPLDGSNSNGFGPFVNRNHFAGWMLMVTSVAMGVLCARIELALDHVKPGLRNGVIWFSSAEANRLLLVAVSIVVMTTALIWTMSRSGIGSLACAVGCVAWLMARRRNVGLAKRVVGIVALGLVLVVSLNWRGIDRVTQWFADTTDLLSRFAAWRDGWHVVRDFPIVGTGLNTYSEAMIFYQTSSPDAHLAQAHNDYLQLLAEGGLLVVVPVAIAVAFLVIAIRRSLNEARSDSYDYWVRAGASVGLLAIAIQETAEFSLQMPANAFLFATLASIAISPRTNPVIHHGQ